MTNLENDIVTLKKRTDAIYIYGTGMYGRNIYNTIKEAGILINGFIETKPDKTNIFGLPVYAFSDIMYDNAGVILGLNKLNAEIVTEYLKNKNYNMENIIYGYEYIDNGGDRGGYDVNVPTMEITTKIGCSINCKYCPQKKLLENYFRDKKDIKQMNMATFKTCLKKLPQNCRILFCGMAEPLLNPDCIEMIKLAIKFDRKVDLYTTLVGINENQLDELLEIPLSFVTLHVADKYNYAQIKADNRYYDMLKKVICATKADGKPFVNICNAQAEPNEVIKKICKIGGYDVIYELHDRAGNLHDEKLISATRKRYGKISCSLCGTQLNHNILLPDGRVILCCMDYGMKHVLGNLIDQSYDEIMNGSEIQKVKRAIDGDESIDVLCRGCSSATEIE